MNKYRYIISGGVTPNSKLSDWRLIASSSPNLRVVASIDAPVVRVDVSDVELVKFACDSYSTTYDSRTLDAHGYDLMIFDGRRWTVRNDLKPANPDERVDRPELKRRLLEERERAKIEEIRRLATLIPSDWVTTHDLSRAERNAIIRLSRLVFDAFTNRGSHELARRAAERAKRDIRDEIVRYKKSTLSRPNKIANPARAACVYEAERYFPNGDPPYFDLFTTSESRAINYFPNEPRHVTKYARIGDEIVAEYYDFDAGRFVDLNAVAPEK